MHDQNDFGTSRAILGVRVAFPGKLKEDDLLVRACEHPISAHDYCPECGAPTWAGDRYDPTGAAERFFAWLRERAKPPLVFRPRRR